MPAGISSDGKNAVEQLDRASKSISVGIASLLGSRLLEQYTLTVEICEVEACALGKAAWRVSRIMSIACGLGDGKDGKWSFILETSGTYAPRTQRE